MWAYMKPAEELFNKTFIFANTSLDFMFVTVILCNKSLETNQISHSRWWFSYQGWITNKEVYFSSRHQNKEIGNDMCILVEINPELSQFPNLRVDFLLKYTMFDHLHW